MTKVMVFGVFDGVHEGHRAFLEEAKHYGSRLIAVVTRDEVVSSLKGRPATRDMENRADELRTEDHVDDVVLGDTELNSWEVIKKYRPDVIALGYDQTELKHALESHLEYFHWPIEIQVMRPHKPDAYHVSILNKK